ncbi:MAG: hypothetical protein DMF89_11555 [Acidobacteria bacterium]|nr:MAG: hypothetical protein DMF90_06065 [Acidobacteriota bacterium]PYR49654.1 MAG: hypothetical protein DMF89_11555 [Acidobacteriota bacterium]
MLEIAVNGEARWSQSGPENWGQVLNLLEAGQGSGRPIVTAVRFDGVVVPTFREPAMLGKTLGDVGRIEVETSTFNQLVHESALAAYESVAPLQRAVTRIAASFRGSEPNAARHDLPSLTAALQGLTVVTAMLTSATGAVGTSRAEFDRLAGRLCVVLDDIVECQTQEDWSGIADTLDGPLSSALKQWGLVLLALNGASERLGEVTRAPLRPETAW